MMLKRQRVQLSQEIVRLTQSDFFIEISPTIYFRRKFTLLIPILIAVVFILIAMAALMNYYIRVLKERRVNYLLLR